LERIKELEARIVDLEAQLDASDEIIVSLRGDLEDAKGEQQAAFLRGLGIGAGGAGIAVLIVWLVSAFAP